jgi:hypothetical protein
MMPDRNGGVAPDGPAPIDDTKDVDLPDPAANVQPIPIQNRPVEPADPTSEGRVGSGGGGAVGGGAGAVGGGGGAVGAGAGGGGGGGGGGVAATGSAAGHAPTPLQARASLKNSREAFHQKSNDRAGQDIRQRAESKLGAHAHAAHSKDAPNATPAHASRDVHAPAWPNSSRSIPRVNDPSNPNDPTHKGGNDRSGMRGLDGQDSRADMLRQQILELRGESRAYQNGAAWFAREKEPSAIKTAADFIVKAHALDQQAAKLEVEEARLRAQQKPKDPKVDDIKGASDPSDHRAGASAPRTV